MMKTYACNCLFDASLLAMKYKDDFFTFKNRCCSMPGSEIWFYYHGVINICFISYIKFV